MSHPIVNALRLSEFGIPPRYRTLSLRDLRPTTRQRDAYAGAQNFVRTLHDRYVTTRRPIEKYPSDPSLIGKGLLFAGPAGTGKTTLAAATLLYVYDLWRLPVSFISMSDFIQSSIEVMHLEKRTDDADNLTRLQLLQSRLHDAMEDPVVLIDDVGREHRSANSEYVAHELYRLLRFRHRTGRPSLVTTNIPPKDWGKVYDPSMGSYVNEAFEIYNITGEDQRAER